MVFRNRDYRPGTTRRVRKRNWDYRLPGYYFLTICIHNRVQLLSEVHQSQVKLKPSGEMVESHLGRISERFSSVTLDCAVIMPNHVHMLVGNAVRTSDEPGTDSIIDMVHWLKSATTNSYGVAVRRQGWPPYKGRLWQEGFYDEIIRDEEMLNGIRQYITDNPARWSEDEFFG